MRLNIHTIAAISAAACASVAGTGFAQGNQAFVLQDSQGASEGNSLRIDQSNATYSQVAGVFRGVELSTASNNFNANNFNANSLTLDGSDATDPMNLLLTPSEQEERAEQQGLGDPPSGNDLATQRGGDNLADINVTGDFTEVGLFQNGSGNKGDIEAGSGTVLLFQEGYGNEGNLKTNNGAARASLLQVGNDNFGTVIVSGVDTSGSEGNLAQIGSDNETTLNIRTDGASVDFTVYADNTNTTVPANVVTNLGGGQITIIQRQY